MSDEPADGAADEPGIQATFCATLVDEWVARGLRRAVVCPGSRNTPVALALAARPEIDIQVFHDERSGAFAALGSGLAEGLPAVVVTTSGTATVHPHAAAVEAHQAGVPLLVVTADRPPELQGVGAPQTIDQHRLYGPAGRFVDPGPPASIERTRWREVAATVWGHAVEPPGPVQLNLPFREPLLGTVGPLPDRQPAPDPGPASPPPPAERLPDAERGVIVAGRHHHDPAAVVALGRALGWPVLADPLSGCRAVTGPVVHHFDPVLRAAGDDLRPTVVLRVGAIVASKVTSQWLAGLDATVVAVADRRGTAPDPEHVNDLVVAGLPGAGGDAGSGPWLDRWLDAERAAGGAIDDVLAAEQTVAGVTEPGLARAVLGRAGADEAVVVSSSMPVRDVEWFGGPTAARVFANRGANGIDGVVATATGVALTGVPTTLLIGDVALLHDSPALVNLARRPIDLTVVAVDNRGGGIFSFLPQAERLPAERFEQLFGTPHDTDLVALARAHGLEAERLDDPSCLGRPDGVRVLVATTDRAANVALHRRLDAAVAAALR